MEPKFIKWGDSPAVAKVGDKVVQMAFTGDTEEGTVVDINTRSVTVEFEDGFIKMPKKFNSFGHLKGMWQYNLIVGWE